MNARSKLVNIGNIQIKEENLKNKTVKSMTRQSSHISNKFDSLQKNESAHPQGSLNYIQRKNQQVKLIEDNIMMLRRIHFAKPTINFDEQVKH